MHSPYIVSLLCDSFFHLLWEETAFTPQFGDGGAAAVEAVETEVKEKKIQHNVNITDALHLIDIFTQ